MTKAKEPRALQAPPGTRKLAVRRKPPGVPLLKPIESTDLMLATVRRTPFSESNWIFEWKYDGFRCLVRKKGDAVELVSRQGNSLNRSFPEIVAAVAGVSGDFVWDAELTVDTPQGYSDFDALRTRAVTAVPMRVRAAALERPARLYLFDALSLADRDLRGLSLIDRKRFLRDSFDDTRTLVFVNGVVGAGEWVFEQVQLHGFEGMVAKRLDSLYQPGRTREWLKIKYAGYGRPAALGFRKKAK